MNKDIITDSKGVFKRYPRDKFIAPTKRLPAMFEDAIRDIDEDQCKIIRSTMYRSRVGYFKYIQFRMVVCYPACGYVKIFEYLERWNKYQHCMTEESSVVFVWHDELDRINHLIKEQREKFLYEII